MTTTAIKQVAILTNPSKPNAVRVRDEAIDWLKKRSIDICESSDAPSEKAIQEADLFICFGGDGTILRVAGKMIDRQVPVLGVNMGSLGFLTEVKVDELYEELKSVFSGHYEVEERMLLTARVEGADGERRFQALNDVVVNREGLTRYMSIKVDVGAECATHFSGDGVIVATPTGSTAYSLSAGGPIIHPSLDSLVITPICAHASAIRPIVVSGNEPIRIRVTCDQDQERALVTADGQSDTQIESNALVEITRSHNRLKMVKSSKRSYFQTLREKFKIPG